jgi:hypothetical protein
MSIEPSVRAIVGKDNVNAFATWAFGPNYEELDAENNIIEVWNALHGHQYRINIPRESNGEEELVTMANIWSKATGTPLGDRVTVLSLVNRFLSYFKKQQTENKRN